MKIANFFSDSDIKILTFTLYQNKILGPKIPAIVFPEQNNENFPC